MHSQPPGIDVDLHVPLQYPVAAWLRPGRIGLAEPLFAAGAGLAAFDRVMRDAPDWTGVWMERLQLQAAVRACRHLGRPESEQTLRDLWQLRTEAGVVGPAGMMLKAYKELGRAKVLRDEVLLRVATHFGNRADKIGGLAQRIIEATGDIAPLQAAATGASLVIQTVGRNNASELLALWVSDALLAGKLGWGRAAPLLSGELPTRRSLHPGEPEWLLATASAAATAALRAVDLANEVARRAARLQTVARQVRTKQAGSVVEVLLNQDAVTAAQLKAILSDRAARRLLDRLVALGGVRELSGRPIFRIYGL